MLIRSEGPFRTFSGVRNSSRVVGSSDCRSSYTRRCSSQASDPDSDAAVMPASARCCSWSASSDTSGVITTLMPPVTTAGSWKQRLLPPESVIYGSAGRFIYKTSCSTDGSVLFYICYFTGKRNDVETHIYPIDIISQNHEPRMFQTATTICIKTTNGCTEQVPGKHQEYALHCTQPAD